MSTNFGHKQQKLFKACSCRGRNKNKLKFCFSFLRLAARAACFLLFVSLTMDIYEKYSSQLTSVGIRAMTQNQNRKEMPCMTACPWDAFKHQGLFYNTEMVGQASFDKEEIFFEHEKFPIFNQSLYSITELRSILFGRCYMVCYTMPLKRNEEFGVMFKKGRDIKGSPKCHLNCWFERGKRQACSISEEHTNLNTFQRGIETE